MFPQLTRTFLRPALILTMLTAAWLLPASAPANDWGPADFYRNGEHKDSQIVGKTGKSQYSSEKDKNLAYLQNYAGRERAVQALPYGTNPTAIGMRNLLWFWQKNLSGRDNSRCPFQPSCSQFAKESTYRYGALFGYVMIGDRFQREYPGMPASGNYPLIRIGNNLMPHDEPVDDFIFAPQNRRWLTREPWNRPLPEELTAKLKTKGE